MSTSLREHAAAARALWSTAKRIPRHVEEGRRTREPLELTIAALVYHERALWALDEDEVHDRVRGTLAPIRPVIELGDRGQIVGCHSATQMLARIDLASAAFRLPLAALKTCQARPSSSSELVGNIDPKTKDWKRGDLVTSAMFGKKCCDPTGGALAALAIVMLVRDDFGHGEAGMRSPRWRQVRRKLLNNTRRCRLIVAEQQLIGWCLERLRK